MSLGSVVKADVSDELRVPVNTDWRSYPFRLVHNDSALDFPAAEGEHADQESDTWFIAGELTATTGRSFAFLTIFNKNRPGGTVVADFYTMALFDCDTGAYGTYTDYDMPPKNMHPDAQPKLSMAAGHLDIHYESSAGTAAWTTCRDDHGEVLPYTYRVSLFGVDQADQPMELDLTVTPTRAPVPVGADVHNGKIVCFGQHDTYSYFQTGMAMHGTLRWGELYERVSGSAGHVDRQWFPKYAGGGGTGGDPRARSHEWRTINLDNGVDISIWRQFDRTDGNALQPFSGATVSYPDPAMAPECAEDVEVTVSSFSSCVGFLEGFSRALIAAQALGSAGGPCGALLSALNCSTRNRGLALSRAKASIRFCNSSATNRASSPGSIDGYSSRKVSRQAGSRRRRGEVGGKVAQFAPRRGRIDCGGALVEFLAAQPARNVGLPEQLRGALSIRI